MNKTLRLPGLGRLLALPLALTLAWQATAQPALHQASGCYQPYLLAQRSIHYAFLRPLALVEANLPAQAARHYRRTERYAAQARVASSDTNREALSFYVLELRGGPFDAASVTLDHARAAAAEANLQTIELRKTTNTFMGATAAGVLGWLQDKDGKPWLVEVRCVGAGPASVYVGVYLRNYLQRAACTNPLEHFRYQTPEQSAPTAPADGAPVERAVALAGRRIRYVLPAALEAVADSATGQVSHYQAATDEMLVGLQAKDTPLTAAYAQSLLAQIDEQAKGAGLRLRGSAQIVRRAFALPALAYCIELQDAATGSPAYGELRLVQLGNTTWELFALGWGADARQTVETSLNAFAW